MFLSALLLWAQFMAPDMAYAYKVKNLCIVNCGVPIGFINASPAVVILPSSSSMGSTQLKWTWDFEPRKPWFKLGCVYVHVNDQMNANVVQCEHPGNTYTTNISWITAGNMYTFILSPYVGDTVPVDSLIQIVAAPGKQTSVDVTGVLP
ncbi:MAG: hypothetical protein CVV16_07895 [Gammaproteobacteria bacterium HGW-Gammaproteobacteria-6]|nr:MAG: hypothetical protein CVV16_07895 [Gammaproteobacteria bacterium HGW-Gammaproteobacteria-6]